MTRIYQFFSTARNRSSGFARVLSFLMLASLWCATDANAQTVVTLPSNQTTWTVPTGVTSVEVEVWGGGGAGASSSGNGGGGGGGAYSKSTLPVLPGMIINYQVGAGALASNSIPGDDSWFISSSTVMAKGGVTATGYNGAVGGAAASGFGLLKFSGGAGNSNANATGGPGGSSAGTGADGNIGSGVNGGVAPTGGGNGGNGAPFTGTNSNGLVGAAPGGGGGGGSTYSPGTTGGNGGAGQILVTYTAPPACTNPTINTQPTATTNVCVNGTSPILSVSATGSGLTYQWYSNTTNSTIGGTLIALATGVTYNVPTNAVGVNYYYVVVSEGTCNTTSAVATVNVTPQIAGALNGVSNVVICANNDASLNIDLDGTPNFAATFNVAAETSPGVYGVPVSTGALTVTTASPTNVVIPSTLLVNNGTTNKNFKITWSSLTDANGAGCTALLTGEVIVTVEPVASIAVNGGLTTATFCSGTGNVSIPVSNPNLVGGTYTVNATYSNIAGSPAASFTNQAYGTFTQTLASAGTTPGTATYIFTPVSPGSLNCAGAPFTVTATVNPTATVDAVTNITVCENAVSNTVVTFAGTATVYDWTNTNDAIGLATTGSGNLDFDATNTTNAPIVGTITVTPKYGTCAGTPGTFTITVNPTPVSVTTSNSVTVNDGDPITYCEGQAVSLAITGVTGATYSLDGPGFSTPLTGTIPNTYSNTASLGDVGAYSLTVTNTSTNGGCVAVTNYSVAVNPEPSNVPMIEGQPATASTYTFCEGQEVTIDLDGIDASYTLTKVGNVAPTFAGSAADPAFNFEVETTDAGDYVLVVTNTNTNCTKTTNYTFVVNPKPTYTAWFGTSTNVLSALNNSVEACEGTDVEMDVLAGNDPNATYVLEKVAPTTLLIASGNVSDGPITKLAELTDNGTYRLTVTNAPVNGAPSCVAFTEYTYTVNPLPTHDFTVNGTVVLANSTTPVCQGAPVALSLTATSGASYSLSFNNTVVGSGLVGTVVNYPFTAALSDGGAYTLTITSADGCETTTTYNLQVNPKPTVLEIADQTVCRNTLTTDIVFSGTPSGVVYNWTNNTPSIGLAASGSSTIAAFNGVNNGSAPVVATIIVTPTANGCAGTSDTFTITVNPEPSVNNVTDKRVCNNAQLAAISLTGSSVANTTYSWTNNTPGIGLADNGTGDIPAFTAINTGTTAITATITVTPSANNCDGPSKTFTIRVNPSPFATITADAGAVCNNGILTTVGFDINGTPGASVVFTKSGPGTASGLGMTSPTTLNGSGFRALDYFNVTSDLVISLTSVSTSGINGCTTPITGQSATTLVNPAPDADFTGPTTVTRCSSDNTVNITGTVTASGNWTVTLNNGGGSATGTGNGTFSIPVTVAPGATVSYSGNIVDNYNGINCSASIDGANRTVTVRPLTSAQIATASNTQICQGEGTTVNVVLTGAASFSGILNVAPEVNPGVFGTPVQIAFTSAGTNYGVNIPASALPNLGSTTQKFRITWNSLTDNNACPAAPHTSGSVDITVNPLPAIAAVTTVTGPICPTTPITYTVTETNNVGGTFNWVAKNGANVTIGTGNNVAYGVNAINFVHNDCAAGDITFILTPFASGASACQGQTLTTSPINMGDVVAPVIAGGPIAAADIEGCAATAVPAALTGSVSGFATNFGLTITDNCTAALTLSHNDVSVPVAGTCPNAFTVTRTYTVTDGCGNTASVDQVFNVKDRTAPAVSATTIASVSLEGCDATVVPAAETNVADLETLGGLTVTDACTNDANLVVAHTDVSTATGLGTCSNLMVTRTYTVTDACGNISAPIVQIFNVNDQTAPAVSATTIASVSLEGCDATVVPAAETNVADLETLGGLTVTDACTNDANLVVAHTDVSTATGLGTCSNLMVTRTYTVTDACGNISAPIVQIFNVNDQTAPAVSATTIASVSLEGCDATVVPAAETNVADLETLGGLTVTDACTNDANLVVAHTDVSTATGLGTCSNLMVTRTYTVTDACGNISAPIVQIFNVNDQTAPAVSATTIASVSLEGCDATVVPAAETNVADLETLGGLTVTDACTNDANLVVAHTDVSTATGLGTCSNLMVTRTYTVTDACGNISAPIVQIFNVADQTGPVLVVGGAIPTTLNVSGVNCTTTMPDYRSFITATDACSGVIPTLSIEQLMPNAPGEPVIGYGGTRDVQFKATDACGNSTIITHVLTLVDQTAPNAIAQDVTVYLGANGIATVAPAQVNNGSNDNCDMNVDLSLNTTSFFCANVGTPNPVILTVMDDAGNSATATANVTVLDTIAPTITNCVPAQTIAKGPLCTNELPDFTTGFGLVAADNCGASSLTITQFPAPGTIIAALVPTIPVTLTVKDASNNTVTCIFNVTYVDQTAPVIVGLPANITQATTAGCAATISWTAPTATDNCSILPGSTITYATSPTANLVNGGSFPVGVTTVTYTAMDAALNTATGFFTVTVTDGVAPVIAGVPTAPIVVDAGASCDATVTLPNITATDACGGIVTLTPSFTGNVFPLGNTLVTYTATDAANNVATASFTVTVNDVTAPTFDNCPSAISVTPNAANCMATVNWTAPTAMDNCSGVTVTSSNNSGDLFPVGATTVTYTATDGAGLTTTCSFVVTVTNDLVGNIGGTSTVSQNVATTSNVVFVAQGGTAPYTFTYTLNGGAPQTISTTGGSSLVTVPQSNALIGTYTYTLLGVTDAYCSGVVNGTNDTAIITVVPFVPVADLTAVLDFDFVSFSPVNNTRPFDLTIGNNGTVNANEIVTVVLTNPGTGSFTYTLDVSSSADWTLTPGIGIYTLTSNAPVNLNANGGTEVVYLNLNMTTNVAAGTIPVSAVVLPASGETNTGNNVSSVYINVSQ